MPPRLELVGTQTRCPADVLLVHHGITYRQLPLQGLIVDTAIDFHLYLQPAPGRLVLFCGPGFHYTERHLERLTGSRTDALWQPCGEGEASSTRQSSQFG